MIRSLILAAGDAAVSSLRARRATGGRMPGLTRRQGEVLAAFARGLVTKEIARELGVSEATVKTHLARACERLGARTRAEAVARYVLTTRR